MVQATIVKIIGDIPVIIPFKRLNVPLWLGKDPNRYSYE
jgi:hypothetical protein